MADKKIILEGYMKKFKTMKKKYFVLFGETKDIAANIRYYDSEKKFKQTLNKREGPNNKKCIILKECFNINRKLDTKYQNVLALYTKEECFCIVFDHEDEMNKWLSTMLRLQIQGIKGTPLNDDEPIRPQFEHIWEVNIEKKGLGETRNLTGPYRLCITDRNLSFIRLGTHLNTNRDPNLDTIDISLGSIRRCGASQCYFYLEIGRVSKTGAGEIWMETPDCLVAQNMHETILKAAKSGKVSDESTTIYHRDRSLSVNETSKPTVFHHSICAGLKSDVKLGSHSIYTGLKTDMKSDNCYPISRERCDSLPATNYSTGTTTNINKANRPFSLCSRSPTVSSPLSPVSYTQSSRSDEDSSFSIDEVDSFDDITKCVRNVSTSHSKMAILEESSEDFSDKVTPKIPDSNEKLIETGTESFSEKDGYLIMLPSTESNKRTEIRSRTSSFAEEIAVTYGYNQRPHLADTLSSSASSITSGTPSTDTRFSAFHLEKTFSHFSEDTDNIGRPTRTYSVGSKPETVKTKMADINILDAYRNTRVRAFSVGSKVKNPPIDTNAKYDTKDRKIILRKNQDTDKSTSVPSLISKHCKNIDSDHVEIDFSTNSGSFPKQSFGLSSSNLNISEYMEMNPSNSSKSKTENHRAVLQKSSQEIKVEKEADYIQMGMSIGKIERNVSKPIEICRKASNNCHADNFIRSCPTSEANSDHDVQITIFPMSLESNSSTTFNKNIRDPDLEPNDVFPEKTIAVDDGDYALLTTNYSKDNVIEMPDNKEDEYTKLPTNYAELYFPQSNTTAGTSNNVKQEEISKPMYAQIVFPDTRPK